jgi:xylan 1,4-beta-xylosidase
MNFKGLGMAFAAAAACAMAPASAAQPQLAAEAQSRHIEVDLRKAAGPLDRSFNFSVGSDYPGTLIRPESLAQLKLAVDELGFR